MKKAYDKFYTVRGSMMPFYDIANALMETEKTLKNIFTLSSDIMPIRRNAYAFISDTKSVRYSEYHKEVNKRCFALDKTLVNIPKESFVAFKVNNSVEWPLFFWGLIAAGYKPLLINPILPKEDTERLIHEADAKAIVTDSDIEYSVPSFNIHKLELGDDKELDIKWADEIAFCTSGTTGDSRVFVYNGEALSHQIYSAYDMPDITPDIMYQGDVRLLAIVPFSHIFGFVAVLLWFTFFGATIVFPKSNNPSDIVEASIKHKCSHLFAVPLFFDTVGKMFKNTLSLESPSKQNLVKKVMDYNNDFITKYEAGIAKHAFIKKAIQRKILGDKVVFCIAGGSALSKDTLQTMNGIGYNLYDGYGMTEIGITSVELSPDVNQRNRGSVGKPLHGVEYKLLDGELLVKSPYLHIARFENGKRIPKAVDEEGFFHTGDMAEFDEDGYVFIKGKKKDVVIGANGENIYPDEIETKFASIANIDNLAVLGTKEKNEELLTLVINVKEGLSKEETMKLESDIGETNQTLPYAMQVRRCYIAKEPLPLNASMKIKKYVLKEEIESKPDNFIKLSSDVNVSFDEYDEKEVQEIIEHIISIIADVLFIDKESIAPNSNINVDLNGDSFSYMSIVASIESEFNVKVPSEMIGRLSSASQFALFILKNRH